MRTTLLTSLFLFVCTFSFSQINDCADAEVICGNDDIVFNPNGAGLDDFADADNDQGCIVALESNSAWYYFEIEALAPFGIQLGFTISPNGGTGEDYDWAVYGPDVSCGDLGSPFRCSSASAMCDFCPETGVGMGATDLSEGPGVGDGFTAMMDVQPGQGFYLLIDNWAGTNNGFVMTWTGTAAGYLDCTATPPCALTASAGTDITDCEDDGPFSLSGGSAGNNNTESYSWTGTNGGTAYLDDPNTQNPTVTLPSGFTGSITYTLTVTEGACMGTDEVIVNINPLPSVSLNPAGPACQEDTAFPLSANPPGGSWTGAPGGWFDPLSNGPGVHPVTYTYSDANGCANMATINITVNSNPTVSISPDPANFCTSDGGVLLTATGAGGSGSAYSYSWNTPSGNIDGPTYFATSSGPISVMVTDGNNCTGSGNVTVTEFSNPFVTLVDPGPLCETLLSYNLQAAPSGGVWSGSVVTADGTVFPNIAGAGTYNLSYTYTDPNACSTTEQLILNIIAPPSSMASNDGPYCAGQTIALFGSTNASSGNISYSWTGPGSYTSSDQNPTDATEAGAYLLTVNVDGCDSELGLTTVVFTPSPNVSATNDGPYCPGQAIQLNGSTTTTGTVISYAWTGPDGYTSDQQNPDDATDDGTYNLVITVDGCNSDETPTEVSFNNAPDAVASNSGPYCTGDAIALSSSTTSTGTTITYTWTGPGTYTSNDQNPTDATEPGIYSVIIDIDGCASEAEETEIVINALPEPAITGDESFCANASSTLDAGTYTSYLWDDSSIDQTLVVTTSGTYSVTVTDTNGCTAVDDINITVNPNPMPTIAGSTSFCAGASTTLDAGDYETYLWTDGSEDQTLVVSTTGDYSVTVTDINGCTGEASVTVTESNSLNPTISGDLEYCLGSSTTLDAGAGFDTYLWSDGSEEQTLVVTGEGNYAVTVSDGGCEGETSVMVVENDLPTLTITGNGPICGGQDINLDAGVGFVDYEWSDASLNQTLNVTTGGTYSVTVTDGNGCTNEASVNVTENPNPEPIITGGASFCSGESLTLDAGDFENYVWSDASINQTLEVSSGNTYSVTVTDINGCTGEDQITITENMIDPPFIMGDSEACEGEVEICRVPPTQGIVSYLWSDGNTSDSISVTSSGTISVTVTDVNGCTASNQTDIIFHPNPEPVISGNLTFCEGESITINTGSYDNYLWSDGSTGSSLTVNSGGTYSVVVTDENGCMGETSVDVTEDPIPTPTIAGSTSFCAGSSTLLDGGSGYDSYFWSDGSSNQTLTVDVAGDYSITVTNSGGCTGEASVTVTESSSLNPVISGDLNYCVGSSTTLDAGAGFSTYLWSDGSITQTIVVDNPGDYGLTVTDGSGCDGETSVNVVENDLPNLSISGNDPICTGEEITLDAGAGFDNYIWSNASLNQTLDVTDGGAYSVTVTDANDCSNEAEVNVTENPNPEPIITGDDTFCSGEVVTLDAGSFDQYQWSDGSVNATLEITSGDSYSVIVTDANGCTGEDQFVVTENSNPDPTLTGDAEYCEGLMTTISVNEIFDNYDWSNGSSTQSIDVNTPGDIDLIVTDVNGCTGTTSISIIENPNPDPSISGSTTFCTGTSTFVDAGDGYDQYLWSDGSLNQTLEINIEGPYSVTVTDNSGCTGEANIDITESQSLEPIITGNLSLCEGENSTLDAGTGFNSYLWSTGEITQSIIASTTDDYTVTVSDPQGCTGESTVSLVVNTNPVVQITGDDIFCSDETVTLDAGNGFSTYLWSDGSATSTITVSTGDTYSVTVSNSSGCTNESNFILIENQVPTPVIIGATSFCTGNSVILDAGTGYDSYFWSDGSTTQTVTISSAIDISVIVTDANGCTGTDQTSITENASLTPEITGILEFCEGGNTVLDAGNGYATYEWSTGEFTQTINVEDGGSYTVIVTDTDGCSGSDNTSVTEFQNPNPVIAGSTTFCTGSSTTLDAGTFDSYLWSDGSTDQTLLVNTPGLYTVDIIDSNGCPGQASIDVSESTSLNPVISGELSFCENSNTIIDAGAGFDSYLWSDGSTDQTYDVSVPGDYSVTVSDGQGCSGETTVSITEVSPPVAVVENTTTCNTTAGGSVLNLYDLVVSGDMNGTWEDADGSGAVGLFDNLNFNNIPAGDYNFIYTTNSAVFPCPENAYPVTVTVIDCSCPDVQFSPADPLCNENGSLDLTTLENTTEDGTWTIITAPAGTNPATVTNGIFDATGGDIGEYTLEFELLNAQAPGCPETYFINLNVDPPAEAGSVIMAPSFCEQDNQLVDLGSLLLNADPNGTWTETSATPSQGGAFDPIAGSFTTNTQFSGVYTFQYTVSSNGACPDDFVEVEVTINQLPTAEAGTAVNLDCLNPENNLDANGSSSGAIFDITWNGPGVVIDGNENTLTPTVDDSGLYLLTITNTMTGCSQTDVVQVTDNFEDPTAFAGDDQELNCDETIATLTASGDILPPFEILWTGPGIDASNETSPSPEVTEPGIYTITIFNPDNNCSSTDVVEVAENIDEPTIVIQSNLEVIDCNSPNVDLIADSPTPGATFEWFDDQNVSIGMNDVVNNIDQEGIYTVVVTGDNGCTATEFIEVNNNMIFPQAEAGNPSLLDCIQEEITLDGSGSDDGSDIIYLWTGPGVSGPLDEDISTATLPGTYTLTVINTSNGCTDTDNVIIDQNVQNPTVVVNLPTELDCTVEEVSLDGTGSSTGANFTATWTDALGNLVSSDLATMVENAGVYTLTIIDTSNGCDDSESVLVTQNTDVPNAAALEVFNPDCFGDDNGFLTINGVTGGNAPYVYSVNGSGFSTNPIFGNLSPGAYDLVIQDINGCDFETTFNITEPAPLELNLGIDLDLILGDSAMISADLNIPDFMVDTIIWYPADLVNCSDSSCLEVGFNTFNSLEVNATVIDINGCTSDDDILVKVKKSRNVYIPNAFSPDGDGLNDEFEIFANLKQVSNINTFRIFNRWGELIHQAENFLPGDIEARWDGSFKGERMNPGVFIYLAEIEFIDGRVEIYKGDVTLLK